MRTRNNNGGDGMAFVLRAPGSDAMQPNNPPGNNGQYMGFAQIEPSLIVEIDTDRNNSADDPDEPRDYLALQRDGNPDHDSPAGSFTTPTTVVWNGASSGATYAASETGWYTATAISEQCQFSDSVYIAFDEPNEPQLAIEQHKCIETDLVLDASEGIGDHLFPVSYLWETGDYSSAVVLDHPGEFGLTIYNACESVSMLVTVDAIDCGCNIFVPSAFTLDNDGRNDRFIPSIGCTPTSYELVILNRWGKEVFQTNDVAEGWLGERQGGKDYFGNFDLYHWKLKLVWHMPESVIPRHEYRSGVMYLLR